MSGIKIYPMTFTPVFRDYRWGGRRLETLYGRQIPPGIVAESWDISGHSSSPTAADRGYWKGQPLPAIFDELGTQLTGTRAGWALARHRFPLLVKLLDAKENLSIQVHPDDAYALTHENGELGKAEMWYVLYADPGTTLVRGVKEGVTPESFRAAIEADDPDAVLIREPVHAGQVFDVPAGTVHALLAGTVVAEIQQNSDTTYRIYDWGKVGADGKRRPVHMDKALDVMDFSGAGLHMAPRVMADTPALRRTEVVRNSYFVVEVVALGAGGVYEGECNGETLEIWGCIQGEATVSSSAPDVALPAIRFALLPAVLGKFRIRATAPALCLRTYLPESA